MYRHKPISFMAQLLMRNRQLFCQGPKDQAMKQCSPVLHYPRAGGHRESEISQGRESEALLCWGISTVTVGEMHPQQTQGKPKLSKHQHRTNHST